MRPRGPGQSDAGAPMRRGVRKPNTSRPAQWSNHCRHEHTFED
ncbi:hypothetical protein ZAKHE101_122 [Mycobacterium phage Zakhe101]|nr:hypothetical protein ZAKHE101_122 [Mycobacterium phage Zakhe101]